MSAIEEVNFWREQNDLPAFHEDRELTEFAQMKAEYRALRGLKNGHQGPQNPWGTVEGTGEATPDWGWLTCAMEDSSQCAGAGICIGWDRERYMVLVIKPPGRPLISHVRPIDTSFLTPNPPNVRDLDPSGQEYAMERIIESKRS